MESNASFGQADNLDYWDFTGVTFTKGMQTMFPMSII